MTASDLIAQAVAAVDFGTATARQRGNDPRWPYVPVIAHAGTPSSPRSWSEQIVGLAFETRREAVEAAERTIAERRASLARRLAEPRYRALRQEHGLPRELADLETGGSSLGLAPDDGRDTDWLDPEALYRVHEQTVRLVLIESVVDVR